MARARRVGARLRAIARELKQRRVYRTGAYYVAAAFVLLEAADILMPELPVPSWTMRTLMVVAVAGLPVALFLSWMFDVGPRDADLSDAVVLRGEVHAVGLLMADDREAVERALQQSRVLVTSMVERFGGRVAGAPGNTFIAIFTDADATFACARETTQEIAVLNETLPAAERVHYRFAIAGGELVEGPGGPAGRAVEDAYELVSTAKTGRIELSPAVHDRLSVDTALPEPHEGEHVADEQVPSAGWSLPEQLAEIDLPVPEKPSIAIMPFAASGDDEIGENVAEGLRIDITNALMKMTDIFLIAPSSMNHFRGRDAEDVAQDLGTRHVLDGTVRCSEGRARVTMQLTDVQHGGLVWSERYDRELDAGFDLQDEISARVVTELDVRLSMGEQARVWRHCLTHPQARAQFYQGLHHFFQSTADSVRIARTRFERVAELVPDSAVGPTWTALALWLQSTRGWTADPATTRDEAVKWAERAAAMEDSDGQAHAVLGAVRLLEGRYDEALAVARDSVAIRPGCNTANGVLANVLLHCGDYELAVVHVKRAIRIAPVYPPLFLEILSAAYREAGHVALAATVAREILHLVPDTITGRLLLAVALVRDGWVSEARQVAAEVRRIDPEFSATAHLAQQPYRDGAVIERLATDLRTAGLPA